MAGNNQRAAKPIHNRSRRGCLTCREHRIKCDETSPTCRNCQRLQQSCRWGVKASFHQSRMFSLSDSDTETLQGIEEEREQIVKLTFVDETPELEAEYLDDSQSARNGASQITSFNVAKNSNVQDDPVLSSEARHLAASGGDESLVDVPQYLDTAPIDDGPHPGLELNPSTNTASSTSNLSSNPGARYHHALPDIPFDLRLKAQLISTFFSETAAWFETTNSLGHFTALYGHLVTKSPSLGAAAMALASRYLELTELTARVSHDLYDFSKTSTTAMVEDNTLLLTAVIQCMFCAMSMDSRDALQSLVRCAALLRSDRWSRSTSGLPAAIYWAFARLDIWKAYSTRSKTLLPSDIWFGDTPDWNFIPVQDSYSIGAIRIFSRVVDWLSEERDNSRDPGNVWAFWLALQTWNLERPDCLKPIVEVELPGDTPIATIIFSNTSAVCGNVFFHAGCILLLETGYVEPSPNLPAIYAVKCHAGRLGAISFNAHDHANLINNIEPILIAARHYGTADEKLAALKHLKDIEVATGWKTSHKSQQLRELWGLQ